MEFVGCWNWIGRVIWNVPAKVDQDDEKWDKYYLYIE